jgi:sortase A
VLGVNKPGISGWLRRSEIVLFVIGCTFLGWAVSATVSRMVYQRDQARAFSRMERVATSQPGSHAGSGADASSDASAAAIAVEDVDPLLLGRIEIPRLGVAAIVREGDDDATLAVAVGHVPGTARPGESGNVVLAGHRDTFFRALRGIRRRDAIRISTPRRQDDYVVDWTEVVGPKETRVLESSQEGRLTLVTCYPFSFVGRAPKRFVVRASLIPK